MCVPLQDEQPKKGKVMSLQANTLFMAMELSKQNWRLCFGDGKNKRQVVVSAGNRAELIAAISLAKKKFGMDDQCPVVSCYEAGRDGFWIHHLLSVLGIENLIIDPASIEVSRRARHCKTDRLDAWRLLDMLLRDRHFKLSRPYSVVVVPSREQEDRMRLNRERDRLIKERTGHRARIRSLCALHGIVTVNFRNLRDASTIVKWDGQALPQGVRDEIQRELERLHLVGGQISELERAQAEALETIPTIAERKAAKLVSLKGIGPQTALLLGQEVFGWRTFRNRKALGAFLGLTGTPYSSGESVSEQGISKAGRGRIRAVVIEFAWSWLRYQPDSDLTKWFNERFLLAGARGKRKGIVALARKLVIALWKYVEIDEMPLGAKLKA